MKKFLLTLTVGMLGVLLTTVPSNAGELDVLLEKLVDKGVLTPIEATIIKDETKQQVAGDLSSAKSYAVPEWVQNIKLKGDLRLRYQNEKRTNDAHSRNRGRLRYRLGVESKVTSQITVGAGLASGGSDPRSTNQTAQDTFSSKGINLDYAYAEYKPTKGLQVIAGKFARKPYLWVPTDLLWDGDINPEGGSVHYERSITKGTNAWINGGIWILDENGKSEENDPFMKYVQTGIDYKHGKMDSKFAVTYYHPDVTGAVLDNNGGTNTNGTSALRSDYRSLALGTEFGFKDLFGGDLPFNLDERIAVFGEYVKNFDDDIIKDNLSGHSFGFKLGHKKIKNPGSWQFKYIKAKLGRDAWLDTFPDSDRFGGDTGIESHEAILNYAWKKNVILGLDYYKSWSQSNSSNKENLIQADVLFKF